jgi:8-oxo-dGTP pyrophosphatase MutT (NUDIX family)
MEDAERVRRVAIALAAMSQTGLTFTENEYDRHRYTAAGELAVELFSVLSGSGELRLELGPDAGYATPKVDARGAIFDADDRVLLMRERSDGKWSLPGGWADPLDTPTTAVIREIREETGYGAEVVSLVGCWDRDTQGHLPRLPVAVYKLFFLCRAVGIPVEPEALETLEIGWFGLDELPTLSLARVTPYEISRCLAHHRDASLPTELD